MTFQVNDASTANGYPDVWVTITENDDGTLSFTVTQDGGIIGDLRGLFFDVADEGILDSLVVESSSTDVRIGDDSIDNLGGGSNMEGLLGSDGGYDVGIEVGTSGIKKDDIQTYEFSLSSTERALTLEDFSAVDFGVRLTSVGTADGSRDDSSKILETTSQVYRAADDTASVDENAAPTTGNVFDNDTNAAGNSNSLTGGTGTFVLDNAEGATFTLNADGSYSLDASTADALSAGESLTYTFNYDTTSVDGSDSTSWVTDSGTITVTVNGVNDGPAGNDDAPACVDENTSASGNVLANDSDVDRLDTLSVASWSGGALGSAVLIADAEGATASLAADGTWVIDASSADALSAGETISQTFSYVVQDNWGATDTASFTVEICGMNDGPDAQDDDAGCVTEGQGLAGDVTGNDSDIDRLDTHTYSLASAWDGPGELTFNQNGTWSYNSGDLADLSDGQERELSFQYVMDDGNGGTDTATVSFCVQGVGGGGGGGDDSFPTLPKDISHAILVFTARDFDGDGSLDGDVRPTDSGGDGWYTVKFDYTGDENNFNNDVGALIDWLVANDDNVQSGEDFQGAQLKAGSVGSSPTAVDEYWADDGDNYAYLALVAGTTNKYELVSDDPTPGSLFLDQDGHQLYLDAAYQWDTTNNDVLLA